MEKYEIVKFEQNGLAIDVNVSPKENTVWLSLNELCTLFERDKSVISRHINNIFKEGELDKKETVAKNATVQNEGFKKVTRQIVYYNLDVIISVGYRVKSKNGILFRKWANRVLSDYLIKGYVINENRVLVTNENYINLINKVENVLEKKVDELDTRLSKIEHTSTVAKEKVYFDGEYFDAKLFLKNIFSTANKSIVLIDPYSDIETLDYFKSKKEKVLATLCDSNRSRLTKSDIKSFNKQYGGLTVIKNDTFHDRFLIIDSEDLYHIGASLNYAGKRTFAVTKMKEKKIVDSIYEKLGLIK